MLQSSGRSAVGMESDFEVAEYRIRIMDKDRTLKGFKEYLKGY